MHDVDLSQRLYFAESDFLTALENGTTMLASYHQTWSTLLDVLRTASKAGSVDHETLSLAHSVASRIANLASCFLEIKRGEELYTASLQSDYDAMLHEMAALDLNANQQSLQPDNRNGTRCTRSLSSTPIFNAEGSSSPFFTSAYQWLLNNLHNPYPTAEVKTRIAVTSSCQVSSINSWFTNARRRIGWTTLCREHFSNCRTDMVDAAYRALVEENPQRALSPQLRHAFVAMKVAAEGLYSSTFTRSAFAGDLDAIVKDMMEKGRESVEVEKCRQVEPANSTKVWEIEACKGFNITKQNLQVARDSYPSPDRSITTSPVAALDDSLTDKSEEEEDVAPPILAGSKRRRSSIEIVDQPSSFARRPIKRLCTSMTSQPYLPSPPSSTDGIDASSDGGSPELYPVQSTQPGMDGMLPSRKRRLSDADATGTPKRPCGPMATPRLHTVSDPLLRSNTENEYSIDDWFNTNFDALFAIPPPVDDTEPDFSASWEVELFKDYSIPGNPKYATAAMAGTQMPAPTDLSDIDNLLQSISGDAFITSSDNVPPMTGVPYAAPLDSSIPNFSQTNIDWTSLLDGPDAYQPTIYSPFPQYLADSQPLPEIDLSMLQLPRVMPVVNSQGDLASKQAKLHQLHAMQETVRRMEQELQSEGVVI